MSPSEQSLSSIDRLRRAQRRVDDMRRLAFFTRNHPERHQRVLNVLLVLEASLFEITATNDMLTNSTTVGGICLDAAVENADDA